MGKTETEVRTWACTLAANKQKEKKNDVRHGSESSNSQPKGEEVQQPKKEKWKSLAQSLHNEPINAISSSQIF